jgi:flagellar biosynthetic protein FlhB
MASDDRTEQPTQRKLDDARKKGQVPRSRHVGEVAGLLAALAMLGFAGQRIVAILATELTNGFSRLSMAAGHNVNAGEVTGLAVVTARAIALAVGPVAVAAALAVFALQSAQGGFVISSEALQPKPNRLSPKHGLQKLKPSRSGMETLKAVLVMTVLAWVGWAFVEEILGQAPRLSRVAPAEAAALGWRTMRGLLWKSAIVLAIVAVADYFWQKHLHRKSLMMTKREVKDDHKMTEGSPETKGRVRKVMAEMFRRRMLAAIPKATVVVTNPTHYAVAIEYQRQTMAAPVIVAIGKDHVAERIKAIAREHGVPMVENVALAQALYKSCDVGDTIPPHLFEAVAEVLAYLIRLKQLVL